MALHLTADLEISVQFRYRPFLKKFSLLRLVVRTLPFQGRNRGSIPLGGAFDNYNLK